MDALSHTDAESVARRRVIIASFAGALLEWYDFFIFGTAAGLVFGPLFFPEESPVLGTIASFAAFGIGFFARPLGGIVFGHYGDLIGRKAMLIWTLLIVGISTFLIGVLPTYGQIGIAAPLLLVLLRLIQGFGLGGEYGGAALMTFESVPDHRRGFFGSLPQMASCAGIMLATGVFALCHRLLTPDQFMNWGWRIPFLLSAAMLVVGMYIRLHIQETDDFKDARKQAMRQKQALLQVPMQERHATGLKTEEAIPLVQIFRSYKREIFLALGTRLVEAVSSNIINAFGIAYLATQLAMNKQIPLTGMLIASALGLISCPFFGWLSDRIGQRRIYMWGSAFCLLYAMPFFLLLNTQNPGLIVLAMVVGYNFGPTMMFAVQPTMYARMFDTRVRYTGLSLAYQISAILGGMTPLIASVLMALGEGSPWYVATYLIVIAALSLFCVRVIRPVNTQLPPKTVPGSTVSEPERSGG
ncbi:MFS transporter [Pantoea sp. BAV 3049]|uniref:MFS transporter n=1 Tax=Pantoea sp. BAV 3049 TaxID=2654188 RepID=UPI00131A9787|nr:MFS transporter [Pantoea sp. BAV 3049]